jgi:hypothetical protein
MLVEVEAADIESPAEPDRVRMGELEDPYAAAAHSFLLWGVLEGVEVAVPPHTRAAEEVEVVVPS